MSLIELKQKFPFSALIRGVPKPYVVGAEAEAESFLAQRVGQEESFCCMRSFEEAPSEVTVL